MPPPEIMSKILIHDTRSKKSKFDIVIDAKKLDIKFAEIYKKIRFLGIHIHPPRPHTTGTYDDLKFLIIKDLSKLENCVSFDVALDRELYYPGENLFLNINIVLFFPFFNSSASTLAPLTRGDPTSIFLSSP